MAHLWLALQYHSDKGIHVSTQSATEVLEVMKPLGVLTRAVAFMGSVVALPDSIAFLQSDTLLCSGALAGAQLRGSSGSGVGVCRGFAGHGGDCFADSSSRYMCMVGRYGRRCGCSFGDKKP